MVLLSQSQVELLLFLKIEFSHDGHLAGQKSLGKAKAGG
jgi:hypothetical protein